MGERSGRGGGEKGRRKGGGEVVLAVVVVEEVVVAVVETRAPAAGVSTLAPYECLVVGVGSAGGQAVRPRLPAQTFSRVGLILPPTLHHLRSFQCGWEGGFKCIAVVNSACRLR